jgi:putative acetyltransferase
MSLRARGNRGVINGKRPLFRLDDLRGPEIAALLEEHLADMRRISPPESVHALDLERLRAPDIRFWTLWQGDDLLGCGALKQLDTTHAEIKSMRTARAHRRQGVAATMLRHLLEQARAAGFARVSLETGSMAEFAPAQALYAAHGFEYCGPFADYVEDPNSVFMTLPLDA